MLGQRMRPVEADGPGATYPSGEDHVGGHELREGGMDGSERLTHGARDLPRGELAVGVGEEEPEDPDLAPGPQDFLDHAIPYTLDLYRFFDYMYYFSNKGLRSGRDSARGACPQWISRCLGRSEGEPRLRAGCPSKVDGQEAEPTSSIALQILQGALSVDQSI